MKHTLILTSVAILFASAAHARIDCEQVINPYNPCHRWADNGAGGMAKAPARGPSEGNNAAPGPAAGSAGPAAGSPGKSPGAGPGKGHGHSGPKGGKGNHGKGKK